MEIQAALQISRAYDGPLDGVMGPETEAALARVAAEEGYTYTPGAPLPEDLNLYLFFALAVALAGDGCEDC